MGLTDHFTMTELTASIVAVWVIVATGMASALWAGITGQIRH